MKDQHPTPPPEQTPSFPRSGYAFLAGFGLFILIQLLLTHLIDTADARLWGINFAWFLHSDVLIVLLSILPVPFLFPNILTRCSIYFAQPKKKKQKWFISIAIMLGFIAIGTLAAWLLRIAYPFLGDGALYVSDLFRVENFRGHESAIIKPTSFLTGHLIVWITKLVHPFDLLVPYLLAGIISIALLVLVLFLFRRRETRASIWLASILFAGSAPALMFFGYVELYALQYVFTVGFFITGWRALRGRNGLWLPTLMLLLAAGAGSSSLIYLPAYVFLVLVARRQQAFGGKETWLALALSVVMILAMVVVYLVVGAAGNAYLIPLLPREQLLEGTSFGTMHYTMFSGAHLLDICNALVLNAAAAVLILLVVLVSMRGKVQWTSTPILFAAIGVLAGIAMLFAGNTTFGLGRDWDLASIFAMPVLFLAFSAMMQLHESKSLAMEYVLPLILAFQFSFLLQWILVNHDGSAASDRMYSLVRMNTGVVQPQDTYNGLENLRKYYMNRKDKEGQARAITDMLGTGYQTMQTYTRLLGVAQLIPEVPKREAKFRWILESLIERARREIPPQRYDYVAPDLIRDCVTRTVLMTTQFGHKHSVERLLPELRRKLPDWKGMGLYTATTDSTLPLAEAVVLGESSVAPDTKDASLLDVMGQLYWLAEQYDNAAIVYRKALALDETGFPKIYMNLARLYDQELHKRDSTVVWLLACVEKCKSTSESKEARNILGQLGVPVPQ